MNRIIVLNDGPEYTVKEDQGETEGIQASLEFELTNPNYLRRDLENFLTGPLSNDLGGLLDSLPEEGYIALVHGAIQYDGEGEESEFGVINDYFEDLINFIKDSYFQAILLEPCWEGDVQHLESYYDFQRTGLDVELPDGEVIPLMLWKR